MTQCGPTHSRYESTSVAHAKAIVADQRILRFFRRGASSPLSCACVCVSKLRVRGGRFRDPDSKQRAWLREPTTTHMRRVARIRALSSRARLPCNPLPNNPLPQRPPAKWAAAPKSVDQASTSAAAAAGDRVAPAMCAMQLTPVTERRDEFDAWLQDGREVLAQALSARRPPSSVPSSRVLLGSGTTRSKASDTSQDSALGAALHSEPHVLQRCFQWIHVPSGDGIAPDLVAIIFTRESDLAHWRASAERTEWLAAGDALARKEPTGPAAVLGSALGSVAAGGGHEGAGPRSIMKDAQAISFTRDDGSLGGWLPQHTSAERRGDAASADGAPGAPPAWKVSATVLLAMYPMQELNRLLLMPSLDAMSPSLWGGCPPSVQLFVACALAAGGTTFFMLPNARRFTERIGFMHTAGPLARAQLVAVSSLVAAYAALMGLGVAASSAASTCGWQVERLGKLTLQPGAHSEVAPVAPGRPPARDA